MDSIEIVADNSMTSATSAGAEAIGSVSSYSDHHPIVQSDSGNQSIGSYSNHQNGGGTAPASPQQQLPSAQSSSPVGGSPPKTSSSTTNSPLKTSTAIANADPMPVFGTSSGGAAPVPSIFATPSMDKPPGATPGSGGSGQNITRANPFDIVGTPDSASSSSHHRHGMGGGFQRTSSQEEDEQTEPSSSATGNNSAGYTRSDNPASSISTFGRLLQNTKKKRMERSKKGSTEEDEDDEDDVVEGALIYGYLQKLGRNGKWQTRWFETDGECLTYYKSDKRQKLLATLDLAKVGSIVINHEDLNGCCFTINIAERPYHLRADSKAACKDWVISLNRVKEARMQEGNVKLYMPDMMMNKANGQPPDLLDTLDNANNNFTPRVVVVANRHRTRAVDDDDMHSWEAHGWESVPTRNPNKPSVTQPSANHRLARWQKPHASLSRLASKLARWARSIRKYGCTDVENHVILDHHVHPPGHDDKPLRSGNNSPRDNGKTDGSVGDRSGGKQSNLDGDSVVGGTTIPNNQEEEEETRELA